MCEEAHSDIEHTNKWTFDTCRCFDSKRVVKGQFKSTVATFFKYVAAKEKRCSPATTCTQVVPSD